MAKRKVHAARKAGDKSSKKKRRQSQRVQAAAGKKGSRAGTARAAGGPAGLKAAAAAHLAWAHETVEKLLASIPPDKITAQGTPTENHALWTMGHLATTYAWFRSLVDGKQTPVPEKFQEAFGMGSTPVADAAAYPSAAEVRRQFNATFKALLRAIDAIKPADLHKPPAAEAYGLAPTRLGVAYAAAWHEGWHSGQLSALRRGLGLPPLM